MTTNDLTYNLRKVTQEFCDADNLWHAELTVVFGKDAKNARYEQRGEGQPGTVLARVYAAREAARKAWDAARETVRLSN